MRSEPIRGAFGKTAQRRSLIVPALSDVGAFRTEGKEVSSVVEADYAGVFVLGLMHPREKSYTSVLENLERRFGSLLHSAPPYAFDYTDYYSDEMGDRLVRHWHVFSRLMSLDELADRKRTTMRLEQQFSVNGLGEGIDRDRWFNLDPGYVTGAKLVLASHKNNSHRIYLRDGVFGEVTLRYEDGEWRTHAWTFPDFRKPAKHGWLDAARTHWLEEN